MRGGFWNTINNNGKPSRGRRSLLGRKNHSENDLPQHVDPQSQQQQRRRQATATTAAAVQQQTPHTTIVLSDNVKTILIAGTPECWSLTTSPSPFKTVGARNSNSSSNQSDCDTSVTTMSSEPSALCGVTGATIDEEEPYEGGGGGSLDWLLTPRRPSPASTKGNRKTATSNSQRHSQRDQQQQQRHGSEPSSMVVMYTPAQTPTDPQGALHVWLTSVDALLKCKEMSTFVCSTRDVVKIAGGIAIRTVFLPVTLPFQVACTAKDFVGWTVHRAISQTTGAILHLSHDGNQTTTTENDGDDDGHVGKRENELQHDPDNNRTRADRQQHDKRPSGNPVQRLLQQLVPVVLGAAGKMRDELGATVIGIVTPPNHNAQQTARKSASSSVEEDKERLERLKLPVFTEGGEKNVVQKEVEIQPVPQSAPSGPTKADFSKYLLRVEDLGVDAPDAKNVAVIYIDLSTEYGDRALLTQCLEQLSTRALALTTTHAPAMSASTTSVTPDVEWKMEGATAKLLRKKVRQSPERWEETFRTEILMWSGNFQNHSGGSPIHRQFPLFFARGVVDQLSPREFVELMWDNSRTCEYNFYCLGRDDLLLIDDRLLASKNVHTGTKVVKSETRVPFTGLSVPLVTMMHCRPLPGGPQEGYILISRSLASGMAGYHTKMDSDNVHKAKSEILWGVNVFRSVPGYPGQTELMSLSQVASAMVPKFLSQKIGIMGIEDFFRNVRNPNPKLAPTSPTTPPADSQSSSPTVELL